MQETTVALATDKEARACLALLPEAVGTPSELLIARRGGAFAGAAAIRWENAATPAGFPTAIHVLPDHRRCGVAQRLLAAAADLASEETDRLWSFAPVPDEGAAARFLAACGCSRRRRQHVFEATVEALLADVAPRADRLRRRGRVQAGLRVASLAEARLDALGWIVADGLGGSANAQSTALATRLRRPDDRSQVLLLQGEPVAAVLWRVDGRLAVIDVRVVDARFRGGAANLLLLEAGLKRGRAEGVVAFRFDCAEDSRDTLRLAERCSATRIETKSTWCYPIDPAASA